MGDLTLPLTGSKLVEKDSLKITLYMTEVQRIVSIQRSATPGGDNYRGFLFLAENAFVDPAYNFATSAAVPILEHADTIIPFPLNVSIDLGLGNVEFIFSEVIKEFHVNRVLCQIYQVQMISLSLASINSLASPTTSTRAQLLMCL